MKNQIDIKALKDFIEHESEGAREWYYLSKDLNNDLDKAYYEGYKNAFYSMSDFLRELEDATED